MNVYARSLLCFVQVGHWLVQLDQIFLLVWDPALNQSYFSYCLQSTACYCLYAFILRSLACRVRSGWSIVGGGGAVGAGPGCRPWCHTLNHIHIK